MKLAGKTALVTGAIRGIGLAVARQLAACGVKCVVTYYDWLDELGAMHQALSEAGAEYLAVAADLTRPEEAAKVVAAAKDRFGGLDILVNNIERGGWPVVHGPYTSEQWDLELRTTVEAKWHLFRSALPLLRQGEGGVVVNVSSIAGLVGRSGPAGLVFNDAYALANRAIGSLTESWAREAAPTVRVNELALGFFDTRHGPGTRGWELLRPEDRAAILNHTLLERVGRIEEAARAVRFLAEEAEFMTGATLRLDGGYILGADRTPPMPEGVVSPGEPTFGGRARPEGA